MTSNEFIEEELDLGLDLSDVPESDLEFDIEDIIREFSDPATELDTFLRQFSPEPPKGRVAWPGDGDTIRLEIPKNRNVDLDQTQETLHFLPPQLQVKPVQQETPAPEEIPEPEVAQEALAEAEAPVSDMPPLQEAAEPFDDAWEPEYEQPMGEYTERDPIPFPPKNRTRMLREKLVAGPEKRFQDLSAAGLGGISIGIVVQTFLFAFSALSTVLLHLNMVNPSQLQIMRFSQLVIILLSGLVGCYRLLSGMGSLLRGKFTTNTLLCAAFLACTVDAYLCLKYDRIAMSALFCMNMLMAQLSAYQQRMTEMGQMDTLRKARELTAMVKIDKFQGDCPGYMAVPGEPEDFMHHYAETAAPEKALWRHSLFVLIVSIVLGIVAWQRLWIEAGVQVMAASMLLGLPATAHVSFTRPAALVQRRLHDVGAVLCGWHGIRYAEKHAIFPLHTQDLFPVESVKMNGVKFCGDNDPGWVTVCASALIAANGCGMQHVFEQLPRGRDGLNQKVEELTVYNGGISGIVSGVPAMVGTAEFMEQMGIELPENTQIPGAVYAAVDGELGGVFVVNHLCDKASAAGLRNLCSWRSLQPVLISDDFLLTHRFLREKLGVRTQRLQMPERSVRQQLRQVQPDEEQKVVALTVNPGLAAKTYALNGAWVLRSAQSFGANIHTMGGLLGLMMVALLLFIGAPELLEPVNLLLYTLFWMIPGWLGTEWARHI